VFEDRSQKLRGENKMNGNKSLALYEQAQFETNEISDDALRRGLQLPFRIQHITEGVGFLDAEVAMCDDRVVRVMINPDGHSWPADFDPGNSQTVFLTLEDAEQEKIKTSYKLYFEG
jgi:hypothetical protein